MNNPVFYKSFEEIYIPDIKPSAAETSGQKIPYSKADETAKNILFPFMNQGRNCRSAWYVPLNKIWEIKWSAVFGLKETPQHILKTEDRICIQMNQGFEIFTNEGKEICKGLRGPGQISLDATGENVLINHPDGLLNSVELKSGRVNSLIYPMFGAGIERLTYAYKKNSLIVAGLELPVKTDRPAKIVDMTLFENLALPPNGETDNDGFLKSYQTASLMCKSVPRLIAFSGNNIMFLTEDNFLLLDDSLKIKAWVQTPFYPIQFSADEYAIIYAVGYVQQENQKNLFLKILDPAGKIYADSKLEDLQDNIVLPPAVGYGDKLFIAAGNKLFCFSKGGQLIWEQNAEEISGYTVLPDDRLAVSEKNMITIFNSAGDRQVIFTGDDKIKTAPVVYGSEIFAATEKSLFCLKIKDK